MTAVTAAAAHEGYVVSRNLDGVKGAWEDLFHELTPRSFIHRWEWHRAVRDHLVDDVTYHLFYEGTAPVAIIPLVEAWTGVGPSVLELPRHPHLDLADALIHPEYQTLPKLERLLATIRSPSGSRPHALHFDTISDDAGLGRGLRPDGARVRRTPQQGTMSCACGDVSDLARLSSKHLRNVDRLRRRAERQSGSVSVRTYEGGESPAEDLEHFARVEEAGWKGPGGHGTSISCRDESRAFYASVLERFGRTGDARVDVLHIGGVPVASQMAVRCDRTWSVLKVGFDEAYSDVGPGTILLKAFIEAMAEDDRIDRVSLVTAPAWAERWHMSWRPTYHIALYSPTVLGRLLLLRHDLRVRWRRGP